MRTWNIGNTTIRSPERTFDILRLFIDKRSGQPFQREEQLKFQAELIDSGLIASERYSGDDSGRKFPSMFKQLGFITDWARGKPWTITPAGEHYLDHPEVEDTIFLRQLLKYQISSPLEKRGTQNFHLRPFRVLLRILKQAYDEGMIGLTKYEIGLFVITVLTEDNNEFNEAFAQTREFRAEYDALMGKVAKSRFVGEMLEEKAKELILEPDTFRDYADSNSRYALMSGILTIKGNKLAVSEARLPFITEILADGIPLKSDEEYLAYFYDPAQPLLPTDNPDFLDEETRGLQAQLLALAAEIGEAIVVPPAHPDRDLLQLQAHERQLRLELRRIKEIKFYRDQRTAESLDEIEQLLEDIRDETLLGGKAYLPAYFEWAIWRVFLAINDLTSAVSTTRGFNVDEDIQPTHHAKGGAADLNFAYDDFRIVCEMTLASGSRQFAMEGEPVTRHVFKTIEQNQGIPTYGLFVTKKLDPNTADAFHNARYWKDWNTAVQTPVVALEIKHILALVRRMKERDITIHYIRGLFDEILELQNAHGDGPAWFAAYKEHFDKWVEVEAE